MNILEWNECSVNVRWMFDEHSRDCSRENECSWMIKNVRKIPLAFPINYMLKFIFAYNDQELMISFEMENTGLINYNILLYNQ